MARKRSKAWKARSKASKKGWATRRAKQAASEAKLIPSLKALSPKLRPSRKKLKELDELAKHLREAQLRAKKAEEENRGLVAAMREKGKATDRLISSLIEAKEELEQRLQKQMKDAGEDEFAGFVLEADMAMLHKDGSLAHSPSRLRHLSNAERLWERLEAVRHDEEAFRATAERIAERFDVEIREVYTFYHSP